VSTAVDDLNETLGLLVPAAPPTWPDGEQLSSISGSQTTNFASGSVPDNTGDGLPTAGSTVDTIYSAGFNTDNVGNAGNAGSGPGRNGTMEALLNGTGIGSVTLTTADDSGTYSDLEITENADFPSGTPGFWRMVRARINGATASAGYNKVQITHSDANNSNEKYFVYDDQLTGTGSTSATTLSDPGGLTTNSSSSVPHFAENQNLTLDTTLNNLSGYTYRRSNALTINSSNTTGNGDPISTQNFDIGDPNMPTDPLAVNDSTASVTGLSVTTADVHAQGTADIRFRNPNGGGFTNISNPIILVMGSATTSAVDEDNIETNGVPNLLSSGASSGNNAARVDMTGDSGTDTPAVSFAPTSANWSGSATLETFDAAVVGGELSRDLNNYSTGYIPAGPDLSGQDASQYATFMFRANPLSKFDIQLTTNSGGVAGVWVRLPGISDDDSTNNYWDGSSADNGWWNMTVSYNGVGVPGTGTGANGSTGCAVAGNIPTGTQINNNRYTCTFGPESAANATNNVILVRIRLDAGQSITDLRMNAASN
jgi:hypothetical protein